MFFCIPLVWGFPTKLKQDPPEPARLCPKCHNYAVHGAKSRMWFEFCYVPSIPCRGHQIWICSTCGWQMDKGDGYDPQPPGGNQQGRPPPPPGMQGSQYPPPPHKN